MDIPKADDRMALGVAAAMAKTTTTQPLPDISNLAPTYGESMDMARAMDSAQRSMRSMDVNPAEFDPGTMATFAAYFRSENTVGSALNSKSLGETLFPTPASPEMSTDAVLNKVKEDNLSEYLHVFQDVENVAQYAARKADLLREIEDKRITSASSFFGAGGAAMLASGILDLPSLLPGSIGVKLGAKGVSTARAAGGVAAGAVLGSTVTEFGLHATQVERTFEESVSSVGGSIILGGALGAGLHQWARRSLNNRVVDAIEERLERQVDDIAAGSPGSKSAGAAHVDAYEQMRARGIDENKPLTSYGMNESLNALGKIKGFVGANFRIPMLDIQNAQSPAVHAARDMLIFSPSIREGDVLGNVVSGPTVIGLVRDLREDFAGVADVAIKQYKGAKAAFKSYDEFDGLVTRALLDPNASVHPAVRATAKAHREVYTKVLDSLIENKVLPPEVKTKYGDTYVPLMFDGGAIQARASEFTDMISAGFRRTLQEEAETALREHALRVQKNVDAKEKIVGVTERVPSLTTTETLHISPEALDSVVARHFTSSERERLLEAASSDPAIAAIMRERDGLLPSNPNQGNTLKELSRVELLTKALVHYVEGGRLENIAKLDTLTQPVINPKTGKQRIEKRIVKEGQQFERDRITREQYDLWTSRVKEDRAGALEIFDGETREAGSALKSIYQEYTQKLDDIHKSAVDRILSDPAYGERTQGGILALRKRALAAHDLQSKGAVRTLDAMYDDFDNALLKESKAAEQQIKRDSSLTDKQRIVKLGQVSRELQSKTAAFAKERRANLDALSKTHESSRAALVQDFEGRLGAAQKQLDSTFDIKNEGDRSARVAELNAELSRQRNAVDAERLAQLEALNAKRRTDKKKLSEQYDTELSAAKQIKDENLGHSKETAQADLKAATVDIRKGLEGPLRLTRDGKVDARKISDEAGALAKTWYDKTTGWNKTTLEHEIPGFADMLKKRRTPVSHIDLLNAGFVRGQSMSMLEDYVRMAGTDSATAAVFQRKAKPFGPDGKPMKEADLIDVGDLKMTSAFDDIKADYDSMRNAIFSSPAFEKKLAGIEKKYAKLLEGADDVKKKELYDLAQEEVRAAKAEVETKLADERERQIANLQHIHDSIRGTNSGGWSQSSLKAAELASGLNTLRLMGGQVISSLTDPIKIAVANGMGNMLKGAVTAWHQTAVPLWNKANAADKGLTRAGAAFMELNLNARIAAMADVNSPLRTDDKSVMWMRKTLDVFSSANGIRFWNGYWKQVSDNATSAWLGQMAYKGWDNLANSERARLGSLRINKDGLDIIKASHEVQTGGRFYEDWPLLDHENWTDKEASRLVRHALGEEIQNSVVTPQAQDRMMFATTPAGRLIWQFRQHMVSNQMRFMGRQLQLASLDNHNAAALGVGLVGLVAAGALVDFMKQLTGQISPTGYIDKNRSPIERHLDEWTKTPGMALYNALDRSDTLGIFIEGSNIADKLGLMGPKSLMQKPFDDPAHLKQASRFKDRHWADAVGGPTVGLLVDAQGATRTISKIATGQKINRGDYRATERLIPGQNIPYIQAATNAFEKYVGDKYAWPNPK